MQRVLHIVGAMNIGGTETMLMNVYRNINRNKVEFHFLEYDTEESYYDKEIEELGGKIIRLNSPSKIGFFKSINVLKNTINENGPYDVVHAHTLFNCGIVMAAARLAGVKVRISHAHTNQETNFRFMRKLYYTSMSFLINKNSTKFLGASKIAGNFLFGEKVVKSDKYEFFPNFINYESIINSTKDLKDELGIDRNELVIGHIGRLIPIKNQKLILKLAKELKENSDFDFKVVLVGDGDLREEIDSLIKKYDIYDKVILTGYRDDVGDLINIMDIFILPSLFEGFGMVVVEAQVGGIPCLISDAIPEEVDLGLDLIERLSINEDIKKWGKAIYKIKDKKILNRNEIEKALKEKGFDKENILNKIYKLYGVD